MNSSQVARRWVRPDQLGPHFDDGGSLLFIEHEELLAKRPYHWAKAALILSSHRHRIAEAVASGRDVLVVRGGGYRQALRELTASGERIETIAGTSHGVAALCDETGVAVLPARGFVTSRDDFDGWLAGRDVKAVKMDDFYRWWRGRSGVLMDGPASPVGGQYSFDADNRQSPPKGAPTLGLPAPWQPVEDQIDASVWADLQRWSHEGRIRLMGKPGPRRFAVTRAEALTALEDFVASRLADFGPFEDAMMADDAVMAHSVLSVPLNLGLLHPMEVIQRVVSEFEAGRAPLNSVEGIVRQLAGWRDWVWHLYWTLGEDYVERSNALGAHTKVPAAWWDLNADDVQAECVRATLQKVAERGWAHHIERLMVLGNWAAQRGFDPAQLNDWFVDAFADATPWVMPANVVGMSQHADGGVVATKPYVAGGAYLSRMSNHCGGCRFNPKVRVGSDACPFTAGYWAYLDRHHDALVGNHRMSKPLGSLRRLADRDALVAQEAMRDPGSGALPAK